MIIRLILLFKDIDIIEIIDNDVEKRKYPVFKHF